MLRIASRRSLLMSGGLAAATVGLTAPAATAAEHAPTTPIAALDRLLAGNARFTQGQAAHPRQTLRDVRKLAAGQHPFAITLACADSRMPPEIIFDQGIGDIFDTRVGGNIVDDMLLGSIEYAVEHFSPPVLVVLGHERCAAITATIDVIEGGDEPPGHIAAIADALIPIIEPVLDEPGDKVDNAVRANILAQVRALTADSDIVRAKVDAGKLVVIGARYDLDTAVVTLVS